MKRLPSLLTVLFLGPLLAMLLQPPVASPEAHWLDSRHVAVTWQQTEPATICVGRIAQHRGDYVLIGCADLDAGPQQLVLPVQGPHDSETVPLEGDVYDVGGVRTAPLGPIPRYDAWLPAVWR